MPLAMLSIGETREIIDFKGKPQMKKHLSDLGFIRGEKVKLLSENASGLILIIKESKVAINRSLASMIIVE